MIRRNSSSKEKEGTNERKGTTSPRTKKREEEDDDDGAPPSHGVDRYKLDMEQAMAMRRAKPTSSASNELSPQDVKLALQGLDQADDHRERGQLESALKLYELSLELLIKILRQPELFEGTDRETLEARVQVGLSDAEQVKEKLKKRKTSSQQQPSESSAESSRLDSLQSLSNALTSALRKGNSRQERPKAAPSRAVVATTATTGRQRPTSGRSRAVVATTATTGRQRPTSGRQTIPSQLKKGGPSTTATEELQQVIQSDFYVDASDLQKTTWDDICGLEGVKQSLQETAILPLMRPDLFNGLRRPQNVLLWGPPGTGKTMLVRAVAQESGCNLFVCTASTLTSKWMGESEKLVRALFDMAQRYAPSIIFFDEVDALLSSRKSEGEHEASRRLKTEVMVQMEGIKKENSNHILVVACTNCPWDLDTAVLRRFPRRIHVPLPDYDARRGLLESLLHKAGKHSLTSRQIASLGRQTEGFSCSDITAVASEASFGPLRSIGGLDAIRKVRAKDVRPVSFKDFEDALSRTTKSISAAQLRRYGEWQQQASP